MDFETELREFIQAALETGIKPQAIVAALKAGSAAFDSTEEAEDDEDDDEDDDGGDDG